MPTSPSNEGEVGLSILTGAGVPNTDFHNLLLTRFTWTPDVVQDEEGEPEIGGGMDVSPPERYGHRGATLTAEGRARPGHLGFFMRLFGMYDLSGGIVLWPGVNETISVTDDGGGPVTVNVLTGSNAVAGEHYTPDEFCAFLKAALDADTTLSQTYTVSFSTSTKKFTISHAGATLSLHWTTTPMIANLMGYDHSADDTGATSYEGDEAREFVGRWQPRDGVNDVISVTDDGGTEDVDILSGTGAVLVQSQSCNAWNLCAGLKAALDNGDTLTETYTVTYSATTQKFTIANDGTTLSLLWTDADNNMADDLGFDDTADDTGATTYTGDNAIQPAPKHRFVPVASRSEMPYGGVLDKMNPDHDLDSYLGDVMFNRLALNFQSRDVARFTAEGRALTWRDGYASGTGTGASGSFTDSAADWMVDQWKNFVLTDSAAATFVIASNTPTVLTVTGTPASGAYTIARSSEADDSASIRTPNTSKGQMLFGSGAYCMNTLSLEFTWNETVAECLTEPEPAEIIPGRRGGSGNADIYLGTEAEAGVFRATYYGASDGVYPSTNIVQRALDAWFQSGLAISGTVGTIEYYGVRVEAPECHMLSYPLEKSGDDPEMATLAMRISRQTQDWGITLITDEQYLYGYFN